MHYRVDRTDDRFRMVRMRATGSALAGEIEAFFRPRPVEQRRLADILPAVPRDSFRGQHALVVGGCRGLGELTAKILIAGGAEVTITYATGRDDAERIVREASSLGFECFARELDVVVSDADRLPEWLFTTSFSHVYYFASPAIWRNLSQWNHLLFEQFARVYVRGFAMLAERIGSGAAGSVAPRFLYPSSIFVESYEKGFAEYCAAKAAGEVLCAQFEHRLGTVFARPRLPRMRTDQTSGLPETAVEDPFPVMLRVVRDFQS
jgi:hypothetical protein